MNLDKIDDVLSDFNTLNLHKLTKNNHTIIISDRTDLASTFDDSGQNFLYANSGEPLEIEPRIGTYDLFDRSLLKSTNYVSVNPTSVTRYKELPKIAQVSFSGDEIINSTGNYVIKYKPHPYTEGTITNLQVSSNSSYVVITKKSDFEFEYKLNYTGTENLKFKLVCKDVSDPRIAYESNPDFITNTTEVYYYRGKIPLNNLNNELSAIKNRTELPKSPIDILIDEIPELEKALSSSTSIIATYIGPNNLTLPYTAGGSYVYNIEFSIDSSDSDLDTSEFELISTYSNCVICKDTDTAHSGSSQSSITPSKGTKFTLTINCGTSGSHSYTISLNYGYTKNSKFISLCKPTICINIIKITA